MNDSLVLILSKENTENENRLKEHYKDRANGREWTVRIDASIIGGFIIFDGDYVFDSSVMGQLERIKRKLLRA